MNKQQLQTFIGKDSITLAETMRKIDVNATGILFLTDSGNKLVACITDGDIRRFLLGGGKIDAPAMKAANQNPKFAFRKKKRKLCITNAIGLLFPLWM